MNQAESNSCLSIYSRSDALPDINQHVDSNTFVGDIQWFKLFESNVLSEQVDSVYFHWESPNEQASITLPMIRINQGYFRPSSLLSMQNYYCADYRPLCTSVGVRAEMTRFFDTLIEAESPDIIALQALDTDAPEYQPVVDALMRPGWRVAVTSCQINWVHELESDVFEHYMSNRPKRVVNTLKRKRKRLYDEGEIEINLYSGLHGLEKGLQCYQQVYDKSWKVAESHERFVLELIHYYASRNELRLGILSKDGMPIAVHFWVVRGNSAFIYKLAHDMQFDKHSPGTVLMAHMLRQVIETDKVSRIDFLTGDDAYKRDWMSRRREKVLLKAYNTRTLLGSGSYIFEQQLRPLVAKFISTIRKTLYRKNNLAGTSQ